MKHNTNRDQVEEFLISAYPKKIRPFDPSEYSVVNKYKNGSFGLSNLSFALYANGHNQRGLSTKHKFGLIFEDGESIFSIGYFQKEIDADSGFLFIVAPTGRDVLSKVIQLVDKTFESMPNLISGVYIRYLKLDSYITMLNYGYLPAKECPFFPEAPEEDETLSNSIVEIDEIISLQDMNIKVKTIPGLSRTSKKKAKYEYSRFDNFLKRNNLDFVMSRLSESNIRKSKEIIDRHFAMLEKQERNVGSTKEDHYNSLDVKMLKNSDCIGFIGKVGSDPVAVYIGEKLSENTFGLYTGFTFRDSNSLIDNLGLPQDQKGISAVSRYSYIRLLGELKKLGFRCLDLGGSELADLNKYKRRFGAKNNPTYWVYKPNTIKL